MPSLIAEEWSADVFKKLADGAYENKRPYSSRRASEALFLAYTQERDRLEQQFRVDCIESAGLSGHPKALAAYRLAWQERHANGLREVADFFMEIAELLK